MAYRDPKRYEFSQSDLERYQGQGDTERAWHCPVRLVKAPDGGRSVWASLWREQATKRGGGSASSLLPVLAFHTWPDKKQDALAAFCQQAREPIPLAGRPRDGWTPWAYVSTRELAAVAGIDKDTVATAFRALERLQLVQTIKAPRPRGEAANRICYRLATTLYPSGGEPFREMGATLFYGGQWSMLPTHSARHLYVTLACLDPVHREYALMGSMYDSGDEEDTVAERVERMRERSRLSLADMCHFSGIPTESTVATARDLLTTPIYFPLGRGEPGQAMFYREECDGRVPTWYARHPNVLTVSWPPEALNDPHRRTEAQCREWRAYYTAQEEAKRRASARKAAKRRAENRKKAENTTRSRLVLAS